MVVKELIKKLRELDKDAVVFMANDPEGNEIRFLNGNGIEEFSARVEVHAMQFVDFFDVDRGTTPCVLLFPGYADKWRSRQCWTAHPLP